MYSEELLDHFRNPRNAGELPKPAVRVEVSNPACGDRLRLYARLEGPVVAEAAYQVSGCTATIAAGSLLTTLLGGRTREEVAGITAEQIDAGLGGLAAESRHAAAICVDAARELARRWNDAPA